MSSDVLERKALIEKACKLIMDDVEEVVEHYRSLGTAQSGDGYDAIHLRLVALGTIETELSHLYAKALSFKHEVEVSKLAARDQVNDAKMEATQKPSFRGMGSTFMTSEEVAARLRSLTFDEQYNYSIWEKLTKEVDYLLETIKVYQMDVGKHRRDADLRVKILSLKF